MQKRYINIIVILFFSILIAVFAVQNALAVKVKLWMVEFNSSLSVVILISIAIGVLLTSIIMFFELRKKQKRIGALQREIEQLQKQIKSKETLGGF